jgi:hypothetical protein
VSKCEFAEFLDSFNIKDDRKYTREEVAAIMGKLPRTVDQWRTNGLWNPTVGPFALESFMSGGIHVYLGIHLKRFIMLKNGIKSEKIT